MREQRRQIMNDGDDGSKCKDDGKKLLSLWTSCQTQFFHRFVIISLFFLMRYILSPPSPCSEETEAREVNELLMVPSRIGENRYLNAHDPMAACSPLLSIN